MEDLKKTIDDVFADVFANVPKATADGTKIVVDDLTVEPLRRGWYRMYSDSEDYGTFSKAAMVEHLVTKVVRSRAAKAADRLVEMGGQPEESKEETPQVRDNIPEKVRFQYHKPLFPNDLLVGPTRFQEPREIVLDKTYLRFIRDNAIPGNLVGVVKDIRARFDMDLATAKWVMDCMRIDQPDVHWEMTLDPYYLAKTVSDVDVKVEK